MKWREDHCYKVESKMSDLIEGLRKQELSNSLPDDELCSSAADALEAMQKENERLKAINKHMRRPGKSVAAHLKRIAELEGALREIKDEVADNFDACAYNIAKQALKGDNDEAGSPQ